MEDTPLDPEEVNNIAEGLYRLDDAVRGLQAQLTALSQQLLAVTGRLYRLEQGQK